MSATEAAVRLMEESLTEKKTELQEAVGPLADEINELEKFLKRLTKGSNTANSGPSIIEEDLIAAVAQCSKSGPASSKDIAKFLGTDTRKIARQLASYAAAEKISGNKDDGYTA